MAGISTISEVGAEDEEAEAGVEAGLIAVP